MKSTKKIELTGIPMLIGIASLALAATTIPVLAGDSSPTVAREERDAILPFRVTVPDAELTELRKRINATRWPDRETVTDASQGVQLALSLLWPAVHSRAAG